MLTILVKCVVYTKTGLCCSVLMRAFDFFFLFVFCVACAVMSPTAACNVG